MCRSLNDLVTATCRPRRRQMPGGAGTKVRTVTCKPAGA